MVSRIIANSVNHLQTRVTVANNCLTLVTLQERVHKVKLLQLLAGTSAWTFWSSAFAFDFLVYAISSVILLVPFFALDQHDLYSDLATLGKGAFLPRRHRRNRSKGDNRIMLAHQ